MKKIIIIGSRGHARSVITACEAMDEYFILGLIDDFREKDEVENGHLILGKTSDIKKINKENETSWFIAVGDNFQRKAIYNKLKPFILDYANIIHPFSYVSRETQTGTGNVFMAGVVVNAGCVIGSHCILNTNSSLDHDSSMGDFSSLAPGVATGGNVSIGTGTAIGINSTIKNKVSIGNNNVIGCGSLVLKDMLDNNLAYGSPCKVIRKREEGEKYL